MTAPLSNNSIPLSLDTSIPAAATSEHKSRAQVSPEFLDKLNGIISSGPRCTPNAIPSEGGVVKHVKGIGMNAELIGELRDRLNSTPLPTNSAKQSPIEASDSERSSPSPIEQKTEDEPDNDFFLMEIPENKTPDIPDQLPWYSRLAQVALDVLKPVDKQK